MPLHATAIGKGLLARSAPPLCAEVLSAPLARLTPRTVVTPGMFRRQLATIRQTGVAYEFEESRVGLACVASPVLGHDGAVVAAVSVAGPTTWFDPRPHAASVHAAACGHRADPDPARHAVVRPDIQYITARFVRSYAKNVCGRPQTFFA